MFASKKITATENSNAYATAPDNAADSAGAAANAAATATQE